MNKKSFNLMAASHKRTNLHRNQFLCINSKKTHSAFFISSPFPSRIASSLWEGEQGKGKGQASREKKRRASLYISYSVNPIGWHSKGQAFFRSPTILFCPSLLEKGLGHPLALTRHTLAKDVRAWPVSCFFLPRGRKSLEGLSWKTNEGREGAGSIGKEVKKKTKSLATRVDNNESLEKSFYTSYTKLTEIKLITIGLASPERIRRWAEKTLPNGKIIGKVTNSNTIHHKTFKPQKGGLFCERIFGPLKDFECACGKTQKPFSFSDSVPVKNPLPFAIDPFSLSLPSFPSSSPSSLGLFLRKKQGPWEGEPQGKEGEEVGEIKGKENEIKTELKRNFCPTCDVEYTWSVSRRYQLGYIELVEPMTHVWYLKATPSYLSILLDIKKKHLENIVYGAETLTLENSFHSFSFIKFSAQSDLSTAPSFSSLPLLLPVPSLSGLLSLGGKGKESREKDKPKEGKKDNLYSEGLSKKNEILTYPIQGRIKRHTIKPTNYKSKGLFWLSQTESKRLEWFSKSALNPSFKNTHKRSSLKRLSASRLFRQTSQLGSFSTDQRAFHCPLPLSFPYLLAALRREQEKPFLFPPRLALSLKSLTKVCTAREWKRKKLSLSFFYLKGKKNLSYAVEGRSREKEASERGGKKKQEEVNQGKQGQQLTKYKLTQQNMIEKAYRHIYSWPRLLARPLLILLTNHKQRINNSLKKDTFKTGIRDITQKFPIELYILSNIERMILLRSTQKKQKEKSIRLTTQKEWKKLYRKAYRKASLKVNQILRKFISRKENSNKIRRSIDSTFFPYVVSSPCLLSSPFNKLSLLSLCKARVKKNQEKEKAGSSKRKKPLNESKEKDNLGLKSSLNAFSKNIKVNSIKQDKFLYLSRMLFQNHFRNSLSIGSLNNKEMERLSSLPAFLLTLPFPQRREKASSTKDKPLRSGRLTNQRLVHNQLSFPFNKNKKQHANLKADLSTFVPLNSIILSDTNIRVATQITIEKQALVMIKEIENIRHCLTKGLVRTVLPKKAFLPYLFFSFPSRLVKQEHGSKPSLVLSLNSSGKLCSFFPSPKRKAKKVRKWKKKQEQWEDIRQDPVLHLGDATDSKGNPLLLTTPLFLVRRKKQILGRSSPFSSRPKSGNGRSRDEKKEKKTEQPSIFQKGIKLRSKLVQRWEEVRPKRRINFAKLVNNIYSLSHRYRWEAGEAGKKDWASFLEFVSAPIFLTDKAIPKYEYRLNPSPLATLLSYQEESFNSKVPKKIENFNSIASFSILKERVLFAETCVLPLLAVSLPLAKHQRAATSIPSFKERGQEDEEKKEALPFSLEKDEATTKGEMSRQHQDTRVSIRGSGLIKALLTELNLKTTLDSLPQRWNSGDSKKTELNKIDKQNRILLYESNKKIYRLKQILVKETFWDYGLSDKKNKIVRKNLKKDIKELLTQRNLLIRRTKLVRKLFISTKSGQCPSSMVLSLLPVLPPDLRPIVKMGSGVSAKVAATDLNKLYQRVIYRNDNFKLSITDPGNSDHSQFSRALLQIAVDNLIQNNKSGVPAEKDSRGRPLKSLSDILKGKQGRFRQYLLGKRVDYSGRSVIIVGPKLKIHQCGIPKEMALELFLPFLLKKILNYNLARTVVGAKALITTNKPLIWELLTEIMRVSPVLLNRAPTLHRLGIQAFIPKLVDGRAILLHPLVCSAFNADFDGDQMAVHVPITVESRAEAWKLMLARNNLLSPATGEPISVPSQDMVLGCYYLTTQCPKEATKKKKGFGFYFKNEEDVLKAYDQQKIDLHALIWLQFNGMIEDTSETELPIEIRITKFGIWKEINPKSHITFNSKAGVHLPSPHPFLKEKNEEAQQLLGKRLGTGNLLEEVGHLALGLDEPYRLGFFKLNHYIKTTPGKIVFNKIIKHSINSGPLTA